MNTEIIFAALPLLVIVLSVYYLAKKPRVTKNLSKAMMYPLLAFCGLAYFNDTIPQGEDKLFATSFGLLTLYCVFIVPIFMHLASAIRQRKKMEINEQQPKE